MVEAILPKDRNGLILRMLFLLALLGVGGGVLFKATQSQAAANDFIVTITESPFGDPVPAGTTFNDVISFADGAGPLATAGFLTALFLRGALSSLNLSRREMRGSISCE